MDISFYWFEEMVVFHNPDVLTKDASLEKLSVINGQLHRLMDGRYERNPYIGQIQDAYQKWLHEQCEKILLNTDSKDVV